MSYSSLTVRRVQTEERRLPLMSRTRQFASDVIWTLTDRSTRFCMLIFCRSLWSVGVASVGTTMRVRAVYTGILWREVVVRAALDAPRLNPRHAVPSYIRVCM